MNIFIGLFMDFIMPMDNRNLNWIIFSLVALIVIFATLALLYNSNSLGFLGLGNKQSSSHRTVLIMPIETGSRAAAPTSASANTQDGSVIRLFYVQGQAGTTGEVSSSNQQPVQIKTPTQTAYNTQQISYVEQTYDYIPQQESYVQPKTNTIYSDYNHIPEKQSVEIQYIPIESEKIVYVVREPLGRESGQHEQLLDDENQQVTSDSQIILSSNLPGSNYNIPAQQLPAIQSAPATHLVDISRYTFYPTSKIIKVGDSVTWINNDNTAHTVTSDSGGELGSNVLQPGQSYTHTFNSAGDFYYHCNIHNFMRGLIIVSPTELRSGHIQFLGNQQPSFRG
jgi:plastocyanin